MELTEKPEKFSILKELNGTVGIPLKFLHVIRNPFDVISTWVLRLFNARLQVNDGTTKVSKQHNETWVDMNKRLHTSIAHDYVYFLEKYTDWVYSAFLS